MPSVYSRSYSERAQRGDPTSAKTVKDTRLIGVEIEAYGGDHSIFANRAVEGVGWSDDGSIDGDNTIEVQTPPASADKLEYILEETCTAMREAGFKVNRSCGLHIHLDGAGIKDAKTMSRIISAYYLAEPIIHAMLPPSRRNNSFCIPIRRKFKYPTISYLLNNAETANHHAVLRRWYGREADDSDIDNEWGSHSKYPTYGERCYGLNLHSLVSFGHLEIRYHSSTLSAKKIKNWARFNLALVNWARNGITREMASRISSAKTLTGKQKLLFNALGLEKDLRRYITKRINEFKKNKTERQ